MTTKAQQQDPAITRLTEIETMFVSLVDRGANRQSKFFVVKADEAGLGPGGECVCLKCGYTEAHKTGEQCNEKACPECGAMMTRKADTGKQVPAEDADNDAKREAQQERSKEYGIEALENGANMSFPSGDPTTLGLYGDPVNLKYPLGYDGNKRDPERIAAAIMRFRPNYRTYSTLASQVKVFTRIVEAALAEGMEVALKPEHPVDAALPAALKAKMKKDVTSDKGDTDGSDAGGQDSTSIDMDEWLNRASAQVEAMMMDVSIESALTDAPVADGDDSPPLASQKSGVREVEDGGSAPSRDGEPSNVEAAEIKAKAEKAEREAETLKKALAEQKRKERDQRAKIAKLKASIGSSTALPTGERSVEPQRSGTSWAGDLARNDN